MIAVTISDLLMWRLEENKPPRQQLDIPSSLAQNNSPHISKVIFFFLEQTVVFTKLMFALQQLWMLQNYIYTVKYKVTVLLLQGYTGKVYIEGIKYPPCKYKV